MFLKITFVLSLVLGCLLIEGGCIHAVLRTKDYEAVALVVGIYLLIDSFIVHAFM